MKRQSCIKMVQVIWIQHGKPMATSPETWLDEPGGIYQRIPMAERYCRISIDRRREMAIVFRLLGWEQAVAQYGLNDMLALMAIHPSFTKYRRVIRERKSYITVPYDDLAHQEPPYF